MTDHPATEPRPFYDGPVCSRCGHEPHDDRPDPRCPEIVGGWDQPMPTPDYCGCADVDALYERLVRAEAAQGATKPNYYDPGNFDGPSYNAGFTDGEMKGRAEAAPQCPCDEYEPCAEHQSKKAAPCICEIPGHVFGVDCPTHEGAAPRAEALAYRVMRRLAYGRRLNMSEAIYYMDEDIEAAIRAETP